MSSNRIIIKKAIQAGYKPVSGQFNPDDLSGVAEYFGVDSLDPEEIENAIDESLGDEKFDFDDEAEEETTETDTSEEPEVVEDNDSEAASEAESQAEVESQGEETQTEEGKSEEAKDAKNEESKKDDSGDGKSSGGDEQKGHQGKGGDSGQEGGQQNPNDKQNKYKNNKNNQDAANKNGNNNFRKNQYNKPNNGLNPAGDAANAAKNAPNPLGDAAKKTGADAAKKAGADTAKKAGADAAKQGAKQAAKQAKKGMEQAAKTTTMALLKNPYFWVVAGVLSLLIFLVILIVITIQTTDLRYGTGEFPYVEMEYSEKIKVKNGDDYSYVDMDDYVAGVLPAEVGEFSASEDTLKAAAIAARTYAQNKMKTQGYIINSTANQVYNSDSKYLDKDNIFYKAAHDTAGVVLVTKNDSNYEYINAEYDALAINSSCGGNETETTFTLCQKGLEIPVDWAKSHGLTDGDLSVYRTAYHGRGMSQWGAYYLGLELNYDFKSIIYYFYDSATIVSLYPPAGQMNLEIKVTSGDVVELEKESVKDFLAKKGKNIKTVNDTLLKEILKVGPGTREAVVTSAVYLVNTFADLGVKIPYQWAGGQGNWYSSHDYVTGNFYGINPYWGEEGHSYAFSHDYNSAGLDCGSFVTWALRTGGLSYPWSGYVGYKSISNVTRYTANNPSSYQGKPGDVLSSSSHVALILDYFEDNGGKGYYTAEAVGYKKGIVIKKRYCSDLDSDYDVIDMSYHYKNSKTSDYETAFQNGRKD